MKIGQLLILLFLIDRSHQKRRVVYFHKFNFKFNPVYMNGTFDQSIWANNTKENPNQILGGVQEWYFKDIKSMFIRFTTHHVATNQIVLDQNFDICHIQKLNVRTASVFNNYKNSTNFKNECPFLSGYYEVKPFQFPEIFIPSFIKTDDIFSTSLAFTTRVGKKMINIQNWDCDWQIVEIDN